MCNCLFLLSVHKYIFEKHCVLCQWVQSKGSFILTAFCWLHRLVILFIYLLDKENVNKGVLKPENEDWWGKLSSNCPLFRVTVIGTKVMCDFYIWSQKTELIPLIIVMQSHAMFQTRCKAYILYTCIVSLYNYMYILCISPCIYAFTHRHIERILHSGTKI